MGENDKKFLLSEKVMDDKKVTNNDDEFHFTEAEEMKGSTDTVVPDFSETKPSKINRRNILIAIGIIVVALSLYKLLDVFFGSDEKKSAPLAVNTQTVPVNPPPTVQIQPQPQVQAPISKLPDMTEPVVELHKNDFASNQQMQVVSNQLNSLSITTQNLSDAVSNMNQQIASLAAQLQSTQTIVSALQPKPKVKSQVTIFKPQPMPPPRWYIQALVPGRAWLIQANGLTTTVKQGDRLYGYGRVTYISVINGLVRTSSGIIIRFSSN